MFPKKRVSRIERKKEAIIARGDLLRSTCGEIWAAGEQHTRFLEDAIGRRIALHPAVGGFLNLLLTFLRARLVPRHRFLAPLFSLASSLLAATGRTSAKPHQLGNPVD